MTNPNDDSNPEKITQQSPPPPPAADLENQVTTTTAASGGGRSNVLRRWKREDFVRRGSLVLRGFGLIFSLLASIIMASNKHGDWREYDRYEEYRYVVAIAILSVLYTGLQTFRQVHEIRTGREMFELRINLAMIDFFGDQIVAYLLISAASSAVPLTNRMREGADSLFTDSSATAISMEFFAFFSLALSALVSGYKLSNQTYI